MTATKKNPWIFPLCWALHTLFKFLVFPSFWEGVFLLDTTLCERCPMATSKGLLSQPPQAPVSTTSMAPSVP